MIVLLALHDSTEWNCSLVGLMERATIAVAVAAGSEPTVAGPSSRLAHYCSVKRELAQLFQLLLLADSVALARSLAVAVVAAAAVGVRQSSHCLGLSLDIFRERDVHSLDSCLHDC